MDAGNSIRYGPNSYAIQHLAIFEVCGIWLDSSLLLGQILDITYLKYWMKIREKECHAVHNLPQTILSKVLKEKQLFV